MRPRRRTRASRASEERAHVRVLLALGVAVFVTHWLYLPPGWLWALVPYLVAGGLGLLAAGAGYRGFGPAAGAIATSAPGLALALRSEYWAFHTGCFPRRAGRRRACSRRRTRRDSSPNSCSPRSRSSSSSAGSATPSVAA
ncbi:hypothetical protein ACFQMA_15440 [Halosimplex aquaticum]|uniref:Uncharacterized protein n=1 Tax=Halosimplex aquaticum TaxID=3026162 RepID=A0ABD5Y1E4_9EURY|nr:hypothetical protein [Halosimplex aquaticum]